MQRPAWLVSIAILTLLLLGACTKAAEDPAVAPNTAVVDGADAHTVDPMPGTATVGAAGCETNWEIAESLLGQTTTIGGPFSGFKDDNDGINLVMSAPKADARFEIRIPEKALPNFEETLHGLKPGDMICVTGKVDTWKGTPEIDLRDPANFVRVG